MTEQERILQLRKELHEHNHRYYVLNQPVISDQDFDFLMHELQELEARHPEMADPNSPSVRVGSDINQNFRQVAHRYPMLSLANTYNKVMMLRIMSVQSVVFRCNSPPLMVSPTPVHSKSVVRYFSLGITSTV